MEKKIKLVMKADKSIHIHLNDEEKYVIRADNRKIEANEIFKMLNHSIGDTYVVTSENIAGQDAKVLEFFEKLLQEITTKIQDIKFTEETY